MWRTTRDEGDNGQPSEQKQFKLGLAEFQRVILWNLQKRKTAD
jgi:hypothetical protein